MKERCVRGSRDARPGGVDCFNNTEGDRVSPFLLHGRLMEPRPALGG